MRKKILPAILYALPAIFFIVCYFLMTVSGEDIVQGANSTPDIIGDMIAAFNHSARFSDMYAWSVINFFDYRFSFGIDIIFRLLDVVMACGIFYLITNLVVGHRPKLELKDALIFLLSFLTVMLTTNGKTFYEGFSMIHNYLLIALGFLIFITPYIYYLQGRKLLKKRFLLILMPLIGLIFGATSNLTPIVMLLTMAILLVVWRIKSHQKINWRRLLTSWQLLGVIGIIIGVLICNLIGPGLNDYTDENTAKIFDYLPFEQIFANPLASIGTLIRHLGFNFGRFIVPIAIMLALILIFNRFTTKTFKFDLKNSTVKSLVFLSAFVLIHLLAVTQINYLVRIMLPAYLAAIIVLLSLFYNTISKISQEKLYPLVALGILAALALITVRAVFAINYQNQVGWVIDNIEDPAVTEFCVTPESVASKNLPFVYLGQEDLIVDWSLPVTTNGTTITYCK